jgi:predicted signal transduction protein with EAL and GGDEF domain
MPFVMIVLLFNLARIFGMVLFFFNRSVHWLPRLFIFILISYFAIAAGPIANTRYFLPVSLLAICCSVRGYIWLLNGKTNKHLAA